MVARSLFALSLYLVSALLSQAQNIGINVTGAAPVASALLDIDASGLPANDKRGLLIPRVTTAERVAIASPATGLLVYDLTLSAFWFFNGTVWQSIGSGPEVDPTWDGAVNATGATWRSGDVGIGTAAAPNSKLQVIGRVFIDNSANAHGLTGNPGLAVDGALGEDIFRASDVGGNRRMVVNSSGWVGLSTTTPTARLSLATVGSQQELGGAAASPVFKSNAGPLGSTAGSTLKLTSIGFTSVAENVSLGIQARRTAAGTSSASTAVGLLLDVDATSPVNGAEIWLLNNGNVGIGTSAPTAKLSVNGTANNSTGSWGVFSDARIKKVKREFTDGLNVIQRLRPVIFNYNERAPFKTDKEQVGVIAQELEKLAPYMVSQQGYGDLRDLREVDNQAYVFLLINAVQELNAMVTTQRSMIEEQRERIDALEAANNKMGAALDALVGRSETQTQRTRGSIGLLDTHGRK